MIISQKSLKIKHSTGTFHEFMEWVDLKTQVPSYFTTGVVPTWKTLELNDKKCRFFFPFQY